MDEFDFEYGDRGYNDTFVRVEGDDPEEERQND